MRKQAGGKMCEQASGRQLLAGSGVLHAAAAACLPVTLLHLLHVPCVQGFCGQEAWSSTAPALLSIPCQHPTPVACHGAQVYPTGVRSFFHGISAAVGKVGAVAAAAAFSQASWAAWLRAGQGLPDGAHRVCTVQGAWGSELLRMICVTPRGSANLTPLNPTLHHPHLPTARSPPGQPSTRQQAPAWRASC